MAVTTPAETGAKWIRRLGFDTVLVHPAPAKDALGFEQELQRRSADLAEKFVFAGGSDAGGRELTNGPSRFPGASGLADAVQDFANECGLWQGSNDEAVLWPVLEIDSRACTLRRFGIRTAPSDGLRAVSPDPGRRGGLSRESPLEALDLPPDVAAGQGLGYLGNTGAWGLEWTTAAPVSDKVWIDVGGRPFELNWSGHENTYELSLRSCVLEGLERTAGALGGGTQVVVSPAVELDARFMSPGAFGRYPDSAYEHELVAFDPAESHEWVEAQSLTSGEPVYVPVELVHYGRHVARRWAFGTSSGWAVGSTSEEAAFFGLVELLERDAIVSSWYGGISPTPVNASTVEEVQDILSRAALLDCQFHVSQVPSQIGMPVMVAVAKSPEAAVFGSAAHPDPRRALIGAVNEAWAYLPERERTARRLRSRGLLPKAGPANVETIDDHASLAFEPTLLIGLDRFTHDDSIAGFPVGDIGPWHPNALAERGPLGAAVDQLAGHGLEALVVAASSPTAQSMAVHVVASLVPGLVPIDFGYRRQRAPQMDRILELAELFTGQRPEAPWPELHPFS
ncbi:MAG: YcaO-like family protein [Bifidobacteriaceae bacterium]|jgi:ribosomal protein S12 methylthiotransferase accessory factor|nr:YcaO-like family protein [Bifidobacteriaceae bacterium]